MEAAPLQSSFNYHFRPLLDAIDELRQLRVVEEGIELPSIVVVGDQSSGKSSVLESLAGINLPHGEGIVTRVPLVVRLQKSGESEITIEYAGGSKKIQEDQIQEEVNLGTLALAGGSKNIVDKPMTLHIRKPDAPDLTMVDLPGITRVPVADQPEDIYEQIREILLKYISSERTIILNVLSATVDFSTCESIRMSQKVDPSGKRTLAVVTKIDRAPEGLYDKVVSNAVKVGLGYVCVRNRTDEEKSHSEAREVEKALFKKNKDLMKLDQEMAGVEKLAARLSRLQEDSIKTFLPPIIKQINAVLSHKRSELQALPQSSSDPAIEYQRVVRKVQKHLEELISGRFTVFMDELEMHYTARLHEMFTQLQQQLSECHPDFCSVGSIRKVINLLDESKSLKLPNFLPPVVFQHLIATKMEEISEICLQVVTKSHSYVQGVALTLVQKFCEAWPNLCLFYKDKVQMIMSKSTSKCEKFVRRKLDKEARIVFTFDNGYMSILESARAGVNTSSETTVSGISGTMFSLCNLKHSRNQQASEMVVTLVAYWKVVQARLTDEIAMELSYALEKALLEDLEDELQLAAMKLKMEKLMGQDPEIKQKRKELLESLDMLQKCSKVVSELNTKMLV